MTKEAIKCLLRLLRALGTSETTIAWLMVNAFSFRLNNSARFLEKIREIEDIIDDISTSESTELIDYWREKVIILWQMYSNVDKENSNSSDEDSALGQSIGSTDSETSIRFQIVKSFSRLPLVQSQLHLEPMKILIAVLVKMLGLVQQDDLEQETFECALKLLSPSMQSLFFTHPFCRHSLHELFDFLRLEITDYLDTHRLLFSGPILDNSSLIYHLQNVCEHSSGIHVQQQDNTQQDGGWQRFCFRCYEYGHSRSKCPTEITFK